MGLFNKNHMRCEYTENTPAPFPVRQIPAGDLQDGMIFVAAPEGCRPATACCGHWPVVVGDSGVQELDGVLYSYWATDEPGECGGPRSANHREPADTLVTIAEEW